jgi:hypothetical protein
MKFMIFRITLEAKMTSLVEAIFLVTRGWQKAPEKSSSETFCYRSGDLTNGNSSNFKWHYSEVHTKGQNNGLLVDIFKYDFVNNLQ